MRSLPVALSAISALLLTGFAAPGVAETRSDRDARHDVVRYDGDELPDGGTTVPGRARVDIVRHRFTYGEKRVVAVIHLNDLRLAARFTWIGVPVEWAMGGGARGYGEMGIVFRRHGPAEGRGSFDSTDAQCSLRHDIDFKTDRVRMIIPAKCLGSPPAVRAYAAAYTVAHEALFADSSPDSPGGHGGVRVPRG